MKKRKELKKDMKGKKKEKRLLRERFAGETPPLTQQPFFLFFLSEKRAPEARLFLNALVCGRTCSMRTHV
jgi:hypothetical protein